MSSVGPLTAPFPRATGVVWLIAVLGSIGLTFTARTDDQRLLLVCILGGGFVLGLFTFATAGFAGRGVPVVFRRQPHHGVLAAVALVAMFGARLLVAPDSTVAGNFWPGVAGCLAGFTLAVPGMWWLSVYLRYRDDVRRTTG